TRRSVDCSERCRKTAEDSARDAVGDAGERLLAWLDKMKPIVQLTPRSRSEARAYAPVWDLLRDVAAKEIALRDGDAEQIVWQTTYTKSSRARQQRALHKLRRPNETQQRSRFHKFLVNAIATKVKELRGTWPSYSGA